jgi:hypothetical protein
VTKQAWHTAGLRSNSVRLPLAGALATGLKKKKLAQVAEVAEWLQRGNIRLGTLVFAQQFEAGGSGRLLSWRKVWRLAARGLPFWEDAGPMHSKNCAVAFEPRLRRTPSLEANGGRPGCGRHRRLLTAGGSQPPTQVHQHRRYGNLDDRVKR